MKRQQQAWLLLLLFVLSVIPATAQFKIPGRMKDVMNKTQQTAEQMDITAEQEVAVGKEVAGKMVAYFHVYDNPKLATYVRKVGAAVALQSERQDVTYSFEILDTPVVNAFAAPGGYVFVTRGLLENVASESELAGVLAHEVGHVAGRHIVRALQRAKLIQTGIKESKSYGEGSEYLDRFASQILTRLIDRGLDPGDERDADQRGVRYAYNAGYRPDGLGLFLEKLDAIGRETPAKTSWLSRTHPPVQERIAEIARQIISSKMELDGRAVLAERYQAAIAP